MRSGSVMRLVRKVVGEQLGEHVGGGGSAGRQASSPRWRAARSAGSASSTWSSSSWVRCARSAASLRSTTARTSTRVAGPAAEPNASGSIPHNESGSPRPRASATSSPASAGAHTASYSGGAGGGSSAAARPAMTPRRDVVADGRRSRPRRTSAAARARRCTARRRARPRRPRRRPTRARRRDGAGSRSSRRRGSRRCAQLVGSRTAPSVCSSASRGSLIGPSSPRVSDTTPVAQTRSGGQRERPAGDQRLVVGMRDDRDDGARAHARAHAGAPTTRRYSAS